LEQDVALVGKPMAVPTATTTTTTLIEARPDDLVVLPTNRVLEPVVIVNRFDCLAVPEPEELVVPMLVTAANSKRPRENSTPDASPDVSPTARATATKTRLIEVESSDEEADLTAIPDSESGIAEPIAVLEPVLLTAEAVPSHGDSAQPAVATMGIAQVVHEAELSTAPGHTVPAVNDESKGSEDTWSLPRSDMFWKPPGPPKERRNSMPSTPEPAAPRGGRVREHMAPKSGWSLSTSPGTKVLVLADSQLRRASAPPAGVEVHAFSGARFIDIYNLVPGAIVHDSVREIIVLVGINNRGAAVKTSEQDFTKMLNALKRLAPRVTIAGISFSPELPRDEVEKLTELNRIILERVGVANYVRPLATSQIRLRADSGPAPAGFFTPNRGRDLVHFDDDTVNRLVQRVLEHRSLNH
jgi:hypothetical protein